MSFIMPVRAMSAAWKGLFEDAHRLLSTADFGFYSFDRVFNRAMLAVYAIASARRERAVELVAQNIADIESHDYPHLFGKRQAEIARYVCACVEAFAGRLTSANRILQRRPCVEGPSVEAMREAALAIWRAGKKPALRDEALDALAQVRAVAWGGVGRVLEGLLISNAGEPAGEESPLTKAELHVLEQLAAGHSPKDIAEELGRSIYTIQAHVQNVIKKLGCSGRQEALSVARKRGLIA
jgi:DNA-binding CsgD family transcriptional regulator